VKKVYKESGLPFPKKGLLDGMPPSPLAFMALWPFQASERSDKKTPAFIKASLHGKKIKTKSVVNYEEGKRHFSIKK